MKRLIAGFIALALVLTLRADDASDMEAKAKRLTALVDKLDSERPSEREDAGTALLAAGADAIPYVIDSIYRKNGKPHLQALEKLLAQEKVKLPAELQLTEDDLKAVIRERCGDGKGGKDGRLYLYNKFLEAVDMYRAGQYDAALDRIAAIRNLEPQIQFLAAIKELDRKCRAQKVQCMLVRTAATSSTTLTEGGKTFKIAFNATNMSGGDVQVWFGPPAEEQNADVREEVLKSSSSLEVTVETQVCEANGGGSSTGHQTTQVLGRYSFKLKPGETVKLCEMEIPALGDATKLVKMVVSANMRVLQIDAPHDAVLDQREVAFVPAEIRVLPGNMQVAAENCLQNMLNALSAGHANDVFLFCNIMPDKDKPLAVEPLLKVLREGQYNEYDKSVARNCLIPLTGKHFRTNEEWLKWSSQPKSPDESAHK